MFFIQKIQAGTYLFEKVYNCVVYYHGKVYICVINFYRKVYMLCCLGRLDHTLRNI